MDIEQVKTKAKVIHWHNQNYCYYYYNTQRLSKIGKYPFAKYITRAGCLDQSMHRCVTVYDIIYIL